jgi:hypothetical protein
MLLRVPKLNVMLFIIKAIKSGRVRSMAHLACMAEMKNTYGILSEILKLRDYLEDIRVDMRKLDCI